MRAWADPLRAELDLWAEMDAVATMWWRDDDLVAPNPALDQLLALARTHRLTPGLAVIPADLGPDLPDRLSGQLVTVMVHGLRHANHARAPEKKSEFPLARDLSARLADARRGLALVRAAFPHASACLVPPWNRLAGDMVEPLGELGYKAISGFGSMPSDDPPRGPRWVNTHVDLVDWRGTRGFIGHAATVAGLVAHLAARRGGRVDRTEATGLLTHHLVTDAAGWRGLEELLETLRAHPTVTFVDPAELIDPETETK